MCPASDMGLHKCLLHVFFNYIRNLKKKKKLRSWLRKEEMVNGCGGREVGCANFARTGNKTRLTGDG